MRYAAVEAPLLVGALIFIACSGGTDQGTVAGPGPAPTEPGEGVERGDDPFDFQSTGSDVTTSTSDTTTSTGTGPCATCADLLVGTVAQEICPGSEGAISAIVGCACSGDCAADCGSTFCAGEGVEF